MNKRRVTTDELRDMMASPKKLPPLESLTWENCWLPTVDDYELEYQQRQITRLRREKILLRAALEGLVPHTPVEPVYALRILELTEDE